MKISKIPGLGRFGVFIDDVDFTNLSHEEWMEIGNIHLNSLVTIIRNTKMSPDHFAPWMNQWGKIRYNMEYELVKKYGFYFFDVIPKLKKYEEYKNDPMILQLEPSDLESLLRITNMTFFAGPNEDIPTPLLRISGKIDDNGRPMGMFAEGELLWHSNESGDLSFTPAVALLGQKNMIGSATGFVTTTDWYERQSESFRSELDEMVLVHKFTPGRINPGLRREQDYEMGRNMCPVDGVEIPLVINSPIGIPGLHYSINTIDSIKGMTKADSDRLFERINKELFVEEFMYDHWYQNNDDLCLFDNSITLHRRLGETAERMAYRYQYDYDKVLPAPWIPYRQEPYKSAYIDKITELTTVLRCPHYKLPTKNS